MNIYKVCDFLFHGQAVPRGPFQGILAHSYNYLKVNIMKTRISCHFLLMIHEKKPLKVQSLSCTNHNLSFITWLVQPKKQ